MRWMRAVRAYAYPASVVPIVLGSVCAWREAGAFSFPRFILALIAGMLYHTGCNLINDYSDHRLGVDRPGTLGGSGVLLDGSMRPREIAAGAAACLAAGTLIGIYFILLHGLPMALLGAAGLLGAILYSAPRCGAKYHALGEPLVFLMMGPGMVLGGYLVQAGHVSGRAALASLPVGFLVAAILQANDTRDIADDRAAGIRTISIRLGPAGARALHGALVLAAYTTLCALVAGGVVPRAALLALLSLPIAAGQLRAFRRFRAEKDGRLADEPRRAALLHLVFGLLMSLGVALG
ncbi:MAG: 1,4-dihydroxy-2-naphthoate octaprenyltransferase [bacterium]|nr:1,4-dihydroxy-2-naphthoate octaprenyltransferase [bacterium]